MKLQSGPKRKKTVDKNKSKSGSQSRKGKKSRATPATSAESIDDVIVVDEAVWQEDTADWGAADVSSGGDDLFEIEDAVIIDEAIIVEEVISGHDVSSDSTHDGTADSLHYGTADSAHDGTDAASSGEQTSKTSNVEASGTGGDTASNAERSPDTEHSSSENKSGTNGATASSVHRSPDTEYSSPKNESGTDTAQQSRIQGRTRKQFTTKEAVPLVYQELERQWESIIGAENHAIAKRLFNEVTMLGKETYQFAIDLITELATELTGVRALNIVPKRPLEYDVEIKRKRALVLKLKQYVAPFIELHAVTFANELNFVAVVDKAKKGLRMDIRRGLLLTFVVPILGEYVVEVKGSGLLTRTEKNQLILSTTVVLPGLDSPITIDIPLTLLFAQNKKK